MDFQQYNDRFEKIADKANLLDLREVYVQETGYKLNKNLGPCIFCNSGHGTHSSSDGAFSIKPSTNMGHCFACGGSTGVVSLIMHHNRLTYKETIHYIAKNYFQETLENPNEEIKLHVQKREAKTWTKPNDEELRQEEQQKQKTLNYILKLAIDNPNKELAKGYLSGRAINIDLPSDDFFFQHQEYNNLPAGVVFLDSENKLLNKRYISNTLPEGVKKSFSYGNLINSVYDKTFRPKHNNVYVTEGVINALSFYSIHYSAIALFATTNYITDVEKFRKYFENKDVKIAFDFDTAGQRAAIKLAKFILENYKVNSIEILLFQEKQDANDLLKNESLKLHINNKFNYLKPDLNYVNLELSKIEADYKNYFPNENYKLYSYQVKDEKEKNDTFKLTKTNQKTAKELAEALKINFETIEKLNIKFLDTYYHIKENIKHTFISSTENPILVLENDSTILIWRPKAQYPFDEYEFLKTPDNSIVGTDLLSATIEKENSAHQAAIAEEPDKNERKKLQRKKPVQSLFICFNLEDYIKIIEIKKEAILLLSDKLDYDYYSDKLKSFIAKIYLLPNNTAQQRMKARAIGLTYIEFLIFKLENEFKTVADYINSLEGNNYIFFKKINTALPFKFWNYENSEIKLNLIAFLNFIQTKGFFSYEDQKDRKGYQYIKIDNRIVKSFDDKDLFVRYIKSYTNDWLQDRGEELNIRNKILTSGEFSEKNISQLKQIELDFENSGKNFQNFFFRDGNMWYCSNGKINVYPQTHVKKHIWENELINYPSKVLEAPFVISYKKEYQILLDNLNKLQKGSEDYLKMQSMIKNTPDTQKYEIEIKNPDNYFMQYLWLTSYTYWKDAEKKGYEIKRNEFWSLLKKEQYLSQEQIDEMKLHLINKITWLGYLVMDYRGPEHDYGLAILDAIDLKNDGLKRDAAGGGKSLITRAISEIKRVLIIKAEAEDFTQNKHRYENYENQRVIVLDDMHKNSRIGDILTDFSNGIQINPKHKKPIELGLTKSPKIIITRNYIDDEGMRVNRRLGRMFVSDFFHDNKGGKYKDKRTPKTFFDRSLFEDDTEQDKSNLINFFANSYLANQKFGEINSPVEELEHYRAIKQIGEPLIEFLDIFLTQETGYIDLGWLYEDFKRQYKDSFSSYQRSALYNTVSNFRKLIEMYCQLNNLVYNPEEILNTEGQIVKRSEKRNNVSGDKLIAKHIFISTKENWEVTKQTYNTEPQIQEPEQIPIFNINSNEEQMPF